MAGNNKTRYLGVVLDNELDTLLRTTAAHHNVAISTIVRDALRAYFQVTTGPRDSGWREGYAAAYRVVQEAVKRAVAEIRPFAPADSAPDDPPDRG